MTESFPPPTSSTVPKLSAAEPCRNVNVAHPTTLPRARRVGNYEVFPSGRCPGYLLQSVQELVNLWSRRLTRRFWLVRVQRLVCCQLSEIQKNEGQILGFYLERYACPRSALIFSGIDLSSLLRLYCRPYSIKGFSIHRKVMAESNTTSTPVIGMISEY